MKRWAICKVDAVENDRIPAVERYAPFYTAYYNAELTVALVLFTAPSIQPALADPDIYVMPDIPLDLTLATINHDQRTVMRNKLIAFGFNHLGPDNQNITSSYRTWGDALDLIGTQYEPAFRSRSIDIQDVES